MYIPEFLCGVVATLIVEGLLLIGYSIYIVNKEGDGDDGENY